jgi:NADPH:quinone reductase-like Zn-dependent oxidoreductase
MEFVLAEGSIQIGRFFWTSVNEQLAAGQGHKSARKLDIAKRGMLSTLYWREYTPAEPVGDWVQVKVHAASLNFKDVLISMVIVEGTVVEGDGLGCECSGVVTRVGKQSPTLTICVAYVLTFRDLVGPDVQSLVPGDRCVVFASGAFSTSLTTNEKIYAKLPDDMSFAGATTLPTVYCTVIYGLIHKAQIRRGQVRNNSQSIPSTDGVNRPTNNTHS